MLRAFILLLVLVNVGLLLLRQGQFGDVPGTGEAEREPARVARQVNPNLVQVVPPQQASAALQAEAASAAARNPALHCTQAGPFTEPELLLAEASLRAAGFVEAQWHRVTQEDSGSYMIYMGPYGEPGLLERKEAELQRRRVGAQRIPGNDPMGPGLDLGRYTLQAEAEADLLRLNGRGVRSARVEVLRPAQFVTLLQVPRADAAQLRLLAGSKLPNGAAFVACVEEGEDEAGAAEAASAPASAAPAALAASRPAAAASRARRRASAAG
ncbi:MAG: hypothetical protein RLY78_1563 [Pseudomonadota bacterium]|jgi:hypothetical protein|uniref:SPOR domain-containing protein n=1 Tax=Pseudaquabacterium rugosum TaxID=2984194 RepID=A0ABU9BII5_9BURK